MMRYAHAYTLLDQLAILQAQYEICMYCRTNVMCDMYDRLLASKLFDIAENCLLSERVEGSRRFVKYTIGEFQG